MHIREQFPGFAMAHRSRTGPIAGRLCGISPGRIVLTMSLVWALALCAEQADAAVMASAECDRAASIAAHETGVPAKLMQALTRQETGRNVDGELRGWPWALNVGGKGQWFATSRDLERSIAAQQASGVTNMDIGCFQINFRWHRDNFASLQDMIDPLENARYAARFLRDLHGETGDWTESVGLFHSRNTQFSKPYLRRFARIYASLDDAASPPTPGKSRRSVARQPTGARDWPSVSDAGIGSVLLSRSGGSAMDSTGTSSAGIRYSR
ncbi:lytic transglycosylase domain-containing protein [Pseudooceanicola sp. 216_PA32_1]|uniref:Lytic transglycosylase domain-containing protein n=1 Tax=Pseudooceanicola pacificus TaxID=2676438 RepID=A0A844WBG3_9RHOB|nr:lytic transglycosylase domain-containing protein [Pseudooceanicola pacificus]MWB76620.1 lytic transglycosylase domain-containing protein [Pseudooceanicola pacificus]